MNLKEVSGGSPGKMSTSNGLSANQPIIVRLNQKIGPYTATIITNESGKFLFIESISIDKNFLSQEQKNTQFKYHDVEHFLEDPE